MSFSISSTTSFSNINWKTFDDRPQINDSMPFCTEENWNQPVKCCMDGYSIEGAIEENTGTGKRAGVKFLEQYPCAMVLN